MRKLCSAVGIIAMMFLLAISVEAKEQDSYTIAWSDLSTGSYTLAEDKGPVFLGDGAEYKFSVTGAPGNARFKWSVSPSGGIHSVVLGQTTESSSLTWQAPMSGSSYEVKVEAWVPGGEEGGDTLKGRWAESLTIPFLDVYLKDGEDEHHGEAYLPAVGGVQEQVFAFVGVANPRAGLEGIKVYWEDGGSSGTPGAWSPTSGRTVGGCENSTKGEVSTTFTVGESAKAGNHQIIKAVIKTAEEHHVTDTDAPKINIFDVKIEEIWSDQLNGVKANYHPDGSGKQDKDYLLIAPRSSGDLKFKAKLDITPNLSALNEMILVRLRDQHGNAKGESSLNGDIAEVTLSPADYAGVQEGNVVAGIELDGAFFQLDKYSKAKFMLVNSTGYYASVAALILHIDPVTFYASNFLSAFVFDENVSPSSYVGSIFIFRNTPDHNVGANFTGQGASAGASIRNNVFDENNSLPQIIIDLPQFRGLLSEVFFLNRGYVLDFFGKTENDHIERHTFTWPWVGDLTWIDSLDLYFAFGNVDLNLTVKAQVEREGLQLNFVKIEGEQTDLYDWDYDSPHWIDTHGARVQTGYPTLGSGGHIFYSTAHFNHFIFDMEYSFEQWMP